MYATSYEEVQQLAQLSEVRRPVCSSANSEIVRVVAGEDLEGVSVFRCDKPCSPSSMLGVPVPDNQESRSRRSEERRIFVGRYGGTRGALDGGYHQGPCVRNKLYGCSLHFVRLMV